MSHRNTDLGILCRSKSAKVVLGRGLINAQPQPDRSKLDECEVVSGELVISRRDAPAVFYLVEEPLDQIPGTVQIRNLMARSEAYRA